MTDARNQSFGVERGQIVSDEKQNAAANQFLELLRFNRRSGKGGTYAVCSAHPAVIDAAIQQAVADGSLLHVESTSSQVNQLGGYTGTTPGQFAQWIRSAAEKAGLPADRVLLGGDHLGPFPWRNEKSESALEKAQTLVCDCVAGGYQKIHLDASMGCADDPKSGISEQTIATRAAMLCKAAEDSHGKLRGSTAPLYVIGTEVPAPGGESKEAGAPAVTKADDVHRTLEVFRTAFVEASLQSAWERVIALVVQPGVEFGANSLFEYDRAEAASLSAALSSHAGMVFEAHSTDYQSAEALTQMVEDHFAILKVGPRLTFAYREAILALSAIERELLGKDSTSSVSRVREALEAAMLQNPSYWRSYYQGEEDEVRRDRIYAYSDRCRYYWNQRPVQEEVTRLLGNLQGKEIPLTLISQFLPVEYESIRAGELEASPGKLIRFHIQRVLGMYAEACSVAS
ncbi:MAG TPA: class II D-tagatose-bisphosphate aldolase, non-catalytic subunit [Candidatus Sulfotelmatobacter sp.]|nr:class II D-tagatose-bisphosphate aldolase, non-catalytic subunit [Candidatus Sulfotelmatobacter sp.]